MNTLGEATIGGRLRALRLWRGMTLAEVAGLAGVSAAYLSMLERGLRPLDRRSTISALAAAIRVSESEITGGPHLGTDLEQSGPHSTIPAVRTALLGNVIGDSVVDSARPLPDLARCVGETVEPLRRACDYLAIGELLPALIDELHYHVARSAGQPSQQLALETLIEACVNASLMAKHLEYLDLAHIATLRAEQAARLLNEPTGFGKAAFLRLHTGPRELRSWDRALIIAARAADALEKTRPPAGAYLLWQRPGSAKACCATQCCSAVSPTCAIGECASSWTPITRLAQAGRQRFRGTRCEANWPPCSRRSGAPCEATVRSAEHAKQSPRSRGT